MAILAGLSPAASVNSNSAVNTSVSSTRRDSQLLEANSNVTNTAEHDSSNAATSCQQSSLILSHTIARSETLESPAYVPSDFTVVPNDVAATQVSEVTSYGVQQGDADYVEPKNEMQTSNDTHLNPSASISIETETPAVVSNVSAYEKLLPAQQATAGKSSKFAAVKRRFTVSKTVLPSSAAPPVVVFSKLTAESDNPREVQNVDDAGHVHIIDKAQSSNVTAANKSPVSEADSSPHTANVSAATEAVTDAPTASASTLESTVIMTDEVCADEIEGDEEDISMSDVVQDAREHDAVLVRSTVCGENVDDQVSDGHLHGNTGVNAEMNSGLGVQQSEVTTESCAASKSADLETGTLPCMSCYQVNWEDSPCKGVAADLHETATTAGEYGIVPASELQESCPAAVGCTAGECASELQCTTDELPFSVASDGILAAQVIDSVASYSTVQRTPSAAPALSCNEHDALQQSVHCDHSSQTAESVPSVVASQCSSPLQHETDDEC